MTRSSTANRTVAADTHASNGETSPHGQTHASPPQNGAARDGDGNGSSPAEPAIADPIVAAETLQATLRTALENTNSLIRLLRRNRKQARLVESTLASLRQLKAVS